MNTKNFLFSFLVALFSFFFSTSPAAASGGKIVGDYNYINYLFTEWGGKNIELAADFIGCNRHDNIGHSMRLQAGPYLKTIWPGSEYNCNGGYIRRGVAGMDGMFDFHADAERTVYRITRADSSPKIEMTRIQNGYRINLSDGINRLSYTVHRDGTASVIDADFPSAKLKTSAIGRADKVAMSLDKNVLIDGLTWVAGNFLTRENKGILRCGDNSFSWFFLTINMMNEAWLRENILSWIQTKKTYWACDPSVGEFFFVNAFKAMEEERRSAISRKR